MKAFQIIGHRNSGKTTTTARVIEELGRRGISVGAVKHSAHDHELDKPGKDSHLHRSAGAVPAAVMSGDQIALYLPRPVGRDPIWLMENHFQGVDVTVIEGWISGPFQKIEVWRKGEGKVPLYRSVPNTVALVSDDSPDCRLPVFETRDVSGLVDYILGRLDE